MQARITAHPPVQAAIVRRVRTGEALSIGRAEGCGLRIDHPSISRAHAQLQPVGDGWCLRDLDSKNGSFLDGRRLRDALLPQAGWLRFGDVYCEFRMLDAAEAAAADDGLRAQRTVATAHTARLDAVAGLDELLDASLRGALELAQCERGFVLLARDDGFEVRASLAMDATHLRRRAFSGSVGAVRRALAERRTVIANDIGREAWLSSRASVVTAGLSALVCLPLHDGERALGAIYADRVRPGAPITLLDQELLEAFAERAALWLAARRATDLLDAHTAADRDAHRWEGIVAAHGGDEA